MRFDLCQNRAQLAAPKGRQFNNLVAVTGRSAAVVFAICHLPRFPGARIVRSDPLCYPHFDYARKRGAFPLLSYQKVNTMTETQGNDPQAGLRSMTGYGALSGSSGDWAFSGDIRAVNGRGLDMRFRAPDWIEGLEPVLRKAVQGHVSRGSVTVSIRVTRDEAAPALALNAAQFQATLELLSEIEAGASAHGLALVPTRACDIAAMRGVVEQREAGTGDTAALRDAIVEAFKAALLAFDEDRAREGAALSAVLVQQLDEVARLQALAAEAAGERADAARAGMERNLARLLEATDVPDEARLLQELALIAVKTDVTEELDRLTAHVAAARALLEAEGPVGRKLDFLMQEFNREANTLCSKAQSSALTAVGLDLKAVIDQMREQVQNIE